MDVLGVCALYGDVWVVPSELENLERDWEMTVLPHPKAPGTATVPPYNQSTGEQETKVRSIIMLLLSPPT